jgi:hypothetical protein
MTGPDRPTLSLPFGRREVARKCEATAGTLPRHELRRMVLEMLD